LQCGQWLKSLRGRGSAADEKPGATSAKWTYEFWQFSAVTAPKTARPLGGGFFHPTAQGYGFSEAILHKGDLP